MSSSCFPGASSSWSCFRVSSSLARRSASSWWSWTRLLRASWWWCWSPRTKRGRRGFVAVRCGGDHAGGRRSAAEHQEKRQQELLLLRLDHAALGLEDPHHLCRELARREAELRIVPQGLAELAAGLQLLAHLQVGDAQEQVGLRQLRPPPQVGCELLDGGSEGSNRRLEVAGLHERDPAGEVLLHHRSGGRRGQKGSGERDGRRLNPHVDIASRYLGPPFLTSVLTHFFGLGCLGIPFSWRSRIKVVV